MKTTKKTTIRMMWIMKIIVKMTTTKITTMMMLMAPINVTTAMAYNLHMKTGHVRGAGTDANVFVKLLR